MKKTDPLLLKRYCFFMTKEISTEGVLDGEITLEPRGDNGFGMIQYFNIREHLQNSL